MTPASYSREKGNKGRSWHQLPVRQALAAIALAGGLYVAVWTIIMVIESWKAVPLADQWDQLISGRDITWSWLVAQHNEHRILFPKLIFIADGWFTHETNIINFAAGVCIQAGLTYLVVRIGIGGGAQRLAEKIWIAGFCISLLFWAIQYENFTWGFQVQFFGVVFAAAAAFTALASGGAGWISLAATIVLETIAVYTLASGIIVPFECIGLAIYLKRSRFVVGVLVIAALALLASYLIGYSTPSHHSDPAEVGHHLLPVLTYMAVDLGGPFANALGSENSKITIAAVAGTIGLLMFGFTGWTMCRRRDGVPPQQTVLLALASFVVAMVLLTAAGRVKFGLEQALSSRYATPVMAFWTSLILLFVLRTRDSGQRRLIVMATILPLQLLVIVSERHFVAVGKTTSEFQNVAVPAVLSKVADNELLTRIYPDPARPLSTSAVLRAAHTSIFHEPWADWLGTPLSDHVTIAPDACLGAFERAEPVGEGTGSDGWRAVGSAQTKDGRAVRRILLADANGSVVGYGFGGLILSYVNIASPNPQRNGWVGAFKASTPESVTAFGLLDGDKTACRIGTANPVSR